MAGDALREKREKARERIGNDPESLAERLSIVDRDAYDFSGYSDKDTRYLQSSGRSSADITGRGAPQPDPGGVVGVGVAMLAVM